MTTRQYFHCILHVVEGQISKGTTFMPQHTMRLTVNIINQLINQLLNQSHSRMESLVYSKHCTHVAV